MKKSQIISAFQTTFIALTILAVIASPLYAQLPPESEWEEQGVCARVRIKLSQDVAITRTAFRATLEIDNAPENVSIENLNVTIDIQNRNQYPSNDLFAISDPELTGISDMNGTGTLTPGSSGKAVWIILPTREAAPNEPKQYYVGGTLSYTESGTEINMPLFPATITVKPDPLLVLNYFLVRNVYSDDPFTEDVIEPAEPFSLGLMMSNEGKGTARKVKITSAQPEIIENEKGLLIDFKIIGTQVNTDQVTPSLTVDLGEIGPAQTSVAQWLMTASLQGKFIEYEASFEHTNDLGDSRTSLIDSVNIRELNHVVRIDIPEDDSKPDFLANDIEDDNFLPDTLYNSNGSTSPVNVVSNAVVNGQISNSNLRVTLTGNAPNGWIYIRVDDPGQEAFLLKSVVRSDGRNIRMEDNAWTTHRTIRLVGESPYRESLLHLFDHIESGSFEYTLTFEGASAEPEPPVMQFIPDRSMVAGIHFGFIVKASDPNGTVPALSLTPLPDGAVFKDKGNGEGLFEWETTVDDAGKYEITVTATDGELTAEQTAIISIYSNTDDDSDNMPDEWETEHFETLARDGSGDFDEDGISDIDEWLNKTDPSCTDEDCSAGADTWMSKDPEDIEPMLGTTWEFTYNGQADTLTFFPQTSTNDIDGTLGLVYYDQNLDFGVMVYRELPSDLGLGEHGFVAATFDDMEEPKYAYAFTIAGDTATGYWSGEFTDPYSMTGRKISGGESVPDLSGLWVHEDWGEMSISQDGQQVNATFTKLSTWMIDDCGYKVGDQALYGTLTDQTITGKVYGLFCGTFRSRCPDQWIIWEDLTLTLSEDGNTLQGQWYNHTIHEDCSIADGGWEPFTLTRKTTITPETGHLVTPDLWIRAVIQTEDKGPIEAVWQQGGDDTMAGGARVIWGYFYASPDDVSWGSKENPDLFVKIWFDASGRTDVNFFHVSVPEIDVYSDYEYDGTADEHGITTMSRRYIRQWYENGLSHSDENYEDGIASPWYYPSGNPSGYPTVNNLRIGSVINTDGGPIDAVWYEGGNSLTAGGHEVLWGYFYASPNDVGWGSRNNPDLFVKVWFDASGRVDVNYFHVSVPDIEVYSDLPSDSNYDEKGTTILDDRYIRHEFWIASDTVRITGQSPALISSRSQGSISKYPWRTGRSRCFRDRTADTVWMCLMKTSRGPLRYLLSEKGLCPEVRTLPRPARPSMSWILSWK